MSQTQKIQDNSTSLGSIRQRRALSRISRAAGEEIAWLAGLTEADGCIHVIKNYVGGKEYLYPQVRIAMTDEDVVQKVANMFGNKVTTLKPGPNSKLTQYVTQVSGTVAVEWMLAIKPYMGRRKLAQINESLMVHENRPDPNEQRRQWSADAVKARTRDIKGRFLRTKGRKERT